MLYQFAGDEVIGLFGIPDQPSGFAEAALDTARALCRIGESVSHHWQRRIDRVQDASVARSSRSRRGTSAGSVPGSWWR